MSCLCSLLRFVRMLMMVTSSTPTKTQDRESEKLSCHCSPRIRMFPSTPNTACVLCGAELSSSHWLVFILSWPWRKCHQLEPTLLTGCRSLYTPQSLVCDQLCYSVLCFTYGPVHLCSDTQNSAKSFSRTQTLKLVLTKASPVILV